MIDYYDLETHIKTGKVTLEELYDYAHGCAEDNTLYENDLFELIAKGIKQIMERSS